MKFVFLISITEICINTQVQTLVMGYYVKSTQPKKYESHCSNYTSSSCGSYRHSHSLSMCQPNHLALTAPFQNPCSLQQKWKHSQKLSTSQQVLSHTLGRSWDDTKASHKTPTIEQTSHSVPPFQAKVTQLRPGPKLQLDCLVSKTQAQATE